MFSGPDPNSAYLDIQAGSGGTEAQDWAEMLLRMYLRWGESHDFEPEVMEVSEGVQPLSKVQRFEWKESTPLGGCVLKPNLTHKLVRSLRLIQVIVATHHSHLFSFHRN